MPTLKEIKSRIASVSSTLKVTSAMKLVASAKLRKAQKAVESMRPYEAMLRDILSRLLSCEGIPDGPYTTVREASGGKVAIVAFSSNSSLCGGFNVNAAAKVKSVLEEYPDATVYSIGRKMADAMRKAGHPSPGDFHEMAEHPSFEAASDLARELMDKYASGELDKVILVHNHFVTTSHQECVARTFLPASIEASGDGAPQEPGDYIIEPDAVTLIGELLPMALRLSLYTALLDSNASEHAARTVAMQTATDNGNNLLDELTLAYNKSRQQKITNEILDLAAGSADR